MVTREELLQGALEAAANGWKVAPAAVNSKAGARGRSWKTERTSDPDAIREMWADTPYNIAGVSGRYLIVDVDVAHGKPGLDSWERICTEYGYTETRVHRSPSGGWHYIYECPPDWELRPRSPLNRDYPAIDLRAGEGESFVILPPSEIDGHRYTVEVDIRPAPAPFWVKQLHDGPSGSEVDRTRVRLDELPPGTVGSRDVRLTRIAGLLRRQGHNFTHIAAKLMAENETWASPLPIPDILRIAQSAERWEPDIMGGISPATTDRDNAALVLLTSDNNLLFRAEDARWTVWDGRKWGTDAFRGSYIEESVVVLEELADRVDSDLLSRLIKRKIAMLSSASGRHGLWRVMPDLPGVTRLNEDFDTSPYLFNAVNGVVDLRSGDMHPHDKKMRLTKIAGAEYDPEADMDEWEKFVLWCCSGDAEQAHWLKVALGQSLIGQVEEQIVLFMFGPGKNGKSQLTEAIRLTLGDYGLESSAELLIAKGKDQLHTEMVASLQSKRLVICPEPEKGSYWAANRVKSLTGGDAITARHLYGREFTFRPSHTLVVHGNYQPEIRDLGFGFRRRLRLIPFTNHVTDDMEVRNLGELLTGPGVLRWLVEGAVEYHRLASLPVCARIAEATDQYMAEQNQFARWYEDHCADDQEGWEPIGDLYSMYRYWAEREGLRFIETKQELGRWLNSQGYKPVTRRQGGGMSARGYKGIKLLQMAVDNLPA